MKKNRLINKLFLFVLLLSGITLATSGCSDDSQELRMGAGQGAVSFRFIKINTFAIGELKEMSTVKITLEREGKRVVLPSLELNGTADSLSTTQVFLEQGAYTIVGYKVFNNKATELLVCEPTDDNHFEVKAGVADSYVLPVEIKNILAPNGIRNALYGICLEAFGEDRSLWPATWKDDNDFDKWENLEFEYDDYGRVLYIVGLTLDKKFAPMKKLSSAITNFPTLESLIICDNNLEELPANFGELNISTLQIWNTKLKSLPKSFTELDLTGLLFSDNQFTEFPQEIVSQEKLMDFTFRNEAIASIPAEIAKLTQLRALNITGTNITAFPDVMNSLYRVSTLNLSNNKNLAALPASIKPEVNGKQESYLRAVYVENCAFTTFPDELITPKLYTIRIAGNKITGINAQDIERITNLETLILDRNRFTSFPKINKESIRMLSLIDCGLTPAQVDRTGMPNLYSKSVFPGGGEVIRDYLFFTKEQYNAIFGTNIK